jgi:hypothetical protein
MLLQENCKNVTAAPGRIRGLDTGGREQFPGKRTPSAAIERARRQTGEVVWCKCEKVPSCL